MSDEIGEDGSISNQELVAYVTKRNGRLQAPYNKPGIAHCARVGNARRYINGQGALLPTPA